MLCAIVAMAAQACRYPAQDLVSETDFQVGFGAKATQRLRLKPVQ
jgi:transposase